MSAADKLRDLHDATQPRQGERIVEHLNRADQADAQVMNALPDIVAVIAAAERNVEWWDADLDITRERELRDALAALNARLTDTRDSDDGARATTIGARSRVEVIGTGETGVVVDSRSRGNRNGTFLTYAVQMDSGEGTRWYRDQELRPGNDLRPCQRGPGCEKAWPDKCCMDDGGAA